jgi:drug/metabolite transporter (DMT)-like permease
MNDAAASRQRRLLADLALLGVAAIWGSAFVVQRVAAGEVGVLAFNGLRFLVGALVILPFTWKVSSATSPLRPLPHVSHERTTRQATAWGTLLAGILLTCGAAFQQAGLKYTTAGNAGFITGLYVVLIPLLLALGGQRRPRPAIWAAAFLSAGGLFLLSTGGVLRIGRGDGLVLVSAVFWALHVILIDWMVRRMDVLRFAAGQYLVCGLISLALAFFIEPGGLKPVLDHWWVVAYTGVISVGLGYTLQASSQRVAPPADAAILLSLEAVFAALAGWVFLQERLEPVQLTGCAVILAGMLLAQSEAFFGKKEIEARG